jgi:hypothetical protein
MRNEKIHVERIKRLLERQQPFVHALRAPVKTLVCKSATPSFCGIGTAGLAGNPGGRDLGPALVQCLVSGADHHP